MENIKNKCSLCNREISSKTNHFGLICLNKMRMLLNMKKVSNIKKEIGLDLKVQLLNWKWFLDRKSKKLLTNRYLVYTMLKNIDLNNAKELITVLRKDIKSINNSTKKENLKSYNMISLSEAYELYKLYNRYMSLFNKTSNYTNEELRNEIQNLPWDTLMFAFSSHYEKKSYLSDLIQVVQFYLWKIAVVFSSFNYKNGSKYLNHSLQAEPEDVYITDKNDHLIQTIIEDDNFKNLINKLIKENESNLNFASKTILNFKKADLFLALNNTTTTITALKEDFVWKMHIVITDTYDFTDLKEAWEYIENGFFRGFIGSILNNSGMASTAFNVMNTYDIKVEFDYEVEV